MTDMTQIAHHPHVFCMKNSWQAVMIEWAKTQVPLLTAERQTVRDIQIVKLFMNCWHGPWHDVCPFHHFRHRPVMYFDAYQIWRTYMFLPILGLAITKTHLYNVDPLKPHFYIVKLGFTGVYISSIYSKDSGPPPRLGPKRAPTHGEKIGSYVETLPRRQTIPYVCRDDFLTELGRASALTRRSHEEPEPLGMAPTPAGPGTLNAKKGGTYLIRRYPIYLVPTILCRHRIICTGMHSSNLPDCVFQCSE